MATQRVIILMVVFVFGSVVVVNVAKEKMKVCKKKTTQKWKYIQNQCAKCNYLALEGPAFISLANTSILISLKRKSSKAKRHKDPHQSPAADLRCEPSSTAPRRSWWRAARPGTCTSAEKKNHSHLGFSKMWRKGEGAGEKPHRRWAAVSITSEM